MIKTTIATLALTATALAQDTGTLSQKFSNKYVAPPGFVNGTGPVLQSYADLTSKQKFGNITPYLWLDYDLGDKAMNEIDAGITYTFPNTFTKPLTVSVGYEHWFFPSGKLLDTDLNTIVTSASYQKNNFSLSLNSKHILDQKHAGHMFWTVADVTLHKTKSFQINAVTKVGAGVNLFGNNGLMHITPGVGLQFSPVKNTTIGANLFHQFGFGQVKDQPYGEISITYKF